MGKTYSKFWVLLVFTIVCSCKEMPKEVDQSSITEIERLAIKEIKSSLIDMWNAIEKEDMERYASYIHPDFTQFGETDPTLNIGKEIEIKGVKEWLENSSNIHTEMEEPIVTIKGDVGWIVYYWKDQGLSNGETFSSKGKSTRIFVKQNGKWLCIHGHYTLLE